MATGTTLSCWSSMTQNVPEEQAADFHKDHGRRSLKGIYSQLGHILVITHRDALEGKKEKAVMCDWKSHACQRVCRSTFAAETMAALEGIEDAMAFRASLAGACVRRGGLDEGSCRDVIPIVPLTDCRSLYDAIKREGGPRAPSEKRLLIDLSALRQLLDGEFDRGANNWAGAPQCVGYPPPISLQTC